LLFFLKNTSQGVVIMVMTVFGGAVITLLQGFAADAIVY
jgi:fucose permease